MNDTKIRHFTYYFRPMMKFYDLKVQLIPQILFVLLLAVAFGARVLAQPVIMDMSIYQQQLMTAYQELLTPEAMADPSAMEALMKIPFSEEYAQFLQLAFRMVGLLLLQQTLMMLLTFFYLGAYLTDLETEKPTAAQYAGKFLKALPRYLGFNLLFFMAAGILFIGYVFAASLLVMIIPMMMVLLFLLPVGWFLLQILFIFKDITLLDTRVGMIKNFSLAWKLSAGNRMMIGRNIFFIVFLNTAISMVTSGTNVLISLFVLSFLEVIVLLIQQRLVALMYINRTRIIKETTQGEVP